MDFVAGTLITLQFARRNQQLTWCTQLAKQKIFILCFTGASGLTHYSISLARELSQHAQVTLVVGKDYVVQGYPSVEFEVLPFFRRSRWYPLDLIRMLFLIGRHRPQVVLFQSILKSAGMEAIAVRLLGLLGIETAMTIHDVLPHYPKPWSRLTHALLYRSFNKLVVHSRRSQNDVLDMGVRQPILVVPHGVYDLFMTRAPAREAARAHLTSFAPDDFVLLFFGKIDSRKGINLFLALRNELSCADRYRFAIAGRAGIEEDQTELRAALEAARVASEWIVHDHNIPFMEVQEYFALADAVVLPYREGTTSGVLKLALAFGKPVIATDVGDLAEALQDGVGVLLPHTCSASDLAEAVRELRKNYGQYEAACAAARERYSWRKIGSEYAHFLAGSISGQSATNREG